MLNIQVDISRCFGVSLCQSNLAYGGLVAKGTGNQISQGAICEMGCTNKLNSILLSINLNSLKLIWFNPFSFSCHVTISSVEH